MDGIYLLLITLESAMLGWATGIRFHHKGSKGDLHWPWRPLWLVFLVILKALGKNVWLRKHTWDLVIQI
jgi:hypothetical protein